MRTTLFSVLLAVSLGVSGTAEAAESVKSVDPGKLTKRLLRVPFGGDLEALMAHLGKNLRADYAERIANTLDIADRDRLTAEVKVKLQSIRDSYVQFIGQKTGYNVSVVSSEFAHNTGEAMIVVPVGRSHDYYFFSKGNLWKVVTTETAQPSLAAYLVHLTEIFGKPGRVDYRDPDKRTEPVAARWDSADLVLEVAARLDYGAITLRFTRREVLEKLSELRGDARPPADTAGEGLDPTILDIMKE